MRDEHNQAINQLRAEMDIKLQQLELKIKAEKINFDSISY